MMRKLLKEGLESDIKKIGEGKISINSVPQKLHFHVASKSWYAFRWLIGSRWCISLITLDSPWMFSTYEDIIDSAETGGGNAITAVDLSTGDSPLQEPKKISDILDGLKEWLELGESGEDPFASWSFKTLTGFDSADNDLFSKV